MKVSIKDLAVTMDVKNSGVEFEIHDNNDKFLGDLVVTKTRVVWCPGKTPVKNGHRASWADFITYMHSLPKA